MADSSQAIVPLDRDTTDGLCELVSMFSQLKIGNKSNYKVVTNDSEDEEEETTYINGEKVITYVTFHKYLPSILASLAKGDTITIMDNRMRSSTDFTAQDSANALAAVPYKSDPFSRLCDENTVISYDNVNHIIKLWDLRKNYTNYHKNPCPRSIIYLSRPDAARNTHTNAFSSNLRQDSNLNDIEDVPLRGMPNISIDTNQKYSLNCVLTWPDSLPSVVATYPDTQALRRSSVIIEELPDDWELPQLKKGEILPLLYKQTNLKRKHPESCDDIYLPKKSVTTCMGCGKATCCTTFCDTCNFTEAKRKSSDDLQQENKRLHTLNGTDSSSVEKTPNKVAITELKGKRKLDDKVEIIELKGKRKLDDDPVPGRKRIHIDKKESLQVRETSPMKAAETNSSTKVAIKCDVGTFEGKSNEVVNFSQYMLDSLLLNSVLATDWKSKLRKENYDPRPAKMPKLYA